MSRAPKRSWTHTRLRSLCWKPCRLLGPPAPGLEHMDVHPAFKKSPLLPGDIRRVDWLGWAAVLTGKWGPSSSLPDQAV